jgi:hypothetical protein
MGGVKWAALCVAATIVVGPKLVGGHAAFPADRATLESTKYLLDRYRAAPAQTASLIRRQASACLSERIGGEASTDLQDFFGELMVYTVRHVEKDRSAFVSGYQALAEREGPAIDGRIATLATADKARLTALVGEFAEGPHSMAGCVAGKLKTTVSAEAAASSYGQRLAATDR